MNSRISFFSDCTLLQRGIIYGERDLNRIIETIKRKGEFSIITGFASSGEFHFGHKVIIDVYNYFRRYASKGYFLICDVDAYVSRPDEKVPSLDKAKEYAINNIANALALGVPKEDIYLQSKRSNRFYVFQNEIAKKMTLRTLEATLGHQNLGKYMAALLQLTDILFPQVELGPLPTLVPVGIEQDPLIRLARDIARKLNFVLPSSIYVAHLPGLTRENIKMSKSIPGSGISLTEDLKDMEKLIENAFTGGKETLELQKLHGGDPEICRIYTLLKYNYPSDRDRVLEVMYDECVSGKLICGECKKIAKEFFRKFLEEHERRYSKYLEVAKEIVRGNE